MRKYSLLLGIMGCILLAVGLTLPDKSIAQGIVLGVSCLFSVIAILVLLLDKTEYQKLKWVEFAVNAEQAKRFMYDMGKGDAYIITCIDPVGGLYQISIIKELYDKYKKEHLADSL